MDNKKRFTDLSVEKMVPVPGRRIEVSDALIPGLALRIPSRAMPWCRSASSAPPPLRWTASRPRCIEGAFVMTGIP